METDSAQSSRHWLLAEGQSDSTARQAFALHTQLTRFNAGSVLALQRQRLLDALLIPSLDTEAGFPKHVARPLGQFLDDLSDCLKQEWSPNLIGLSTSFQ